MNRRMILYLICQILRIEAVTMIPAAVIAIVQKEYCLTMLTLQPPIQHLAVLV